MKIVRYDGRGNPLPVSYIPKPVRLLQDPVYIEIRSRIIARLVADHPVLDAEIGAIVRHRRAQREKQAQAHVRKMRRRMARRLSIGLTNDHHGRPLTFGTYHRAVRYEQREGALGWALPRRKVFVWVQEPSDQQILDDTGYSIYARLRKA